MCNIYSMVMMICYKLCTQVARRCWSGNKLAGESIRVAMSTDDALRVTLPHDVNSDVDSIIDATLSAAEPHSHLHDTAPDV